MVFVLLYRSRTDELFGCVDIVPFVPLIELNLVLNSDPTLLECDTHA
jgi:hypothetical protein